MAEPIAPDPEMWARVTKLIATAALETHGQQITALVVEDYSKARSLTAHLLAALAAVHELPCPTESLDAP